MTTFCIDCGEKIDGETDPVHFHRDQCADCHHIEVEASRSPPVAPSDEETKSVLSSPLNTLLDFGVPKRTARAVVKFRLDRDGSLAKPIGVDPLSSIYIHGPVSTGKTVLAAALLHHHFVHASRLPSWRRTFEFVSVSEVLFDLRSTYRGEREDETERTILDRLKNVGVLVLDDLTAVKMTDWAFSMLYLIVNYRYEWERPTIFTSNFSLAELDERMEDARIPTRIDRWCEVVLLKGWKDGATVA